MWSEQDLNLLLTHLTHYYLAVLWLATPRTIYAVVGSSVWSINVALSKSLWRGLDKILND